jgi:hypothetical protein
MATVHYRDAKLLIDGSNLSASLNELSVEQSAEMLDETAFGDDTRVSKGGLFTDVISGGGHAEFEAEAIEDIVFNRVGTDGTVFVVFPNGITEGTVTEMGFAMLGVIESFTLGGAVGTLLPISFSAQSRGIVP